MSTQQRFYGTPIPPETVVSGKLVFADAEGSMGSLVIEPPTTVGEVVGLLTGYECQCGGAGPWLDRALAWASGFGRS